MNGIKDKKSKHIDGVSAKRSKLRDNQQSGYSKAVILLLRLSDLHSNLNSFQDCLGRRRLCKGFGNVCFRPCCIIYEVHGIK